MSAPRGQARHTLVTGATGFLGRHLVAVLGQAKARPVRLFARAVPASQRGDCVDAVEGSILDRSAVKRAVRGCDRIFHLAGLVSRRREDSAEMFRLHVDGTRILCEEALAAGVNRMVLVSTSGTIGVSDDPDRLATEESEEALEMVRRWPYYLSKIYQEHEVLKHRERGGLDVVIVNPSLLLGPGDERGSSTGDVVRFLRREIPAVPDGGLSFVDVRDVAAVLPAAMERGRVGQRYLLGAANWTMARFLDRLEQLSGVAGPRFKPSSRVANLGSWLVDALDQLGARGALDPVSAEMSRCFWYVDSTRAQSELGFSPRDPAETLLDTIRDIRERMGSDLSASG